MPRRITFFVSGTPKAEPRPRAWAAKIGCKYTARMYKAKTAEAWKNAIAMQAAKHVPDSPIEGPVHCDLTFMMPRPKRLMRKCDPSEPFAHTQKPDRDNLDKAVLDVLTVMGFWRDDCQVWSGMAMKMWCSKDGLPGVMVSIMESGE